MRDPLPAVRRRTADDLDGCVRALAAVHARDGYPVNWPDRPGDWLARPSQYAAWVAQRDCRIVGHIALSPAEAGDVAPGVWSRRRGVDTGATAVVGRLFVDPAARGHGFGALLIAQAVSQARERGLHPVLDVVASDAAATALYERLGWELLATTEQRWGPGQTVALRSYGAPGPAPG